MPGDSFRQKAQCLVLGRASGFSRASFGRQDAMTSLESVKKKNFKFSLIDSGVLKGLIILGDFPNPKNEDC